MVHVLLSMDRPFGREGETLHDSAPVTLVMLLPEPLLSPVEESQVLLPETETGEVWPALDPLSPNCPLPSAPQHIAEPLSRMAQVWEAPEESATAVRPVPRLLVSVGVDLTDVCPLPNWPEFPRPQHDTAPLSRMAQVWEAPVESATAVRPVPRLLVSVGVDLSDVAPLPNWP